MSGSTDTSLEEQINSARQSISSDGYPMSIGELTNLYKEGELIIRPEFQRFFRWNEDQKSRLIESLLLGIPLPSIFVAQQQGGKWELVDGLQRVSTILQLQGVLKDSPPLQLLPTKYLPALDGKVWEDSDPAKSLSEAQRLDIKRSKIDVKIIKRESSRQTKFDLFQRLNSYGTTANAQEVRSALMVAVSADAFSWLEKLASSKHFRICTQFSERLLEERYDLEIALRFLVLHNRPESGLRLTSLRDFSQVLDNESVRIAEEYPKNARKLERVFTKTFEIVASNGGDLVFKKWDPRRKEFIGSFLNTAFEIFGLGLGYCIANRLSHRTDLLNLVIETWAKPKFSSGFATGRSTEARLAEFVPLGRELLRS
jgi:hypothetical protein